MSVRAGSLSELQGEGRLLTKVGAHPVVVLWHEGRAYAVEDRCPHLGFPLRHGTLDAGLLTCHWHHARFDLASGCTLDPWADDARAFDVDIVGDEVFVAERVLVDEAAHRRRRLEEGLENGISLVIAKSVLALLEANAREAGIPHRASAASEASEEVLCAKRSEPGAERPGAEGAKSGKLENGAPPGDIVRTGLEFGARYNASGWGAGMTVLVAMANLLPHLDAEDRGLALLHGLVFVTRDTRGRPPRFPLEPLGTDGAQAGRLPGWYRRFIDIRSADAAERVIATAVASDLPLAQVEEAMFAAATDHVFLDGGHTIDFTNKAFESLEHAGSQSAGVLLPTLVAQTARASRAEEAGEWRHPHDLAALAAAVEEDLPKLLAEGAPRHGSFDDVAGLGWRLLADDPEEVVAALVGAITAGATPAQLGQGLAYAAALRIVRFHTQNDLADWDSVHPSFTAANALHQALVRNPAPATVRGVVHGALRVYLDRFLNVPAARLPHADTGDLAELAECWDVQGAVDRAGGIAYGFLRAGGDPARLIAALGHALLREDAGFHWYQTVEAAIRQYHAWPAGSEEGALVLTAATRFLASQTPTRRELSRVFDIARRLRRGDALYEELSDAPEVTNPA